MLKNTILSSLATFFTTLLVAMACDIFLFSPSYPVEKILLTTLLVSGVFFGTVFSPRKSHSLTVITLSILFGFLLFIGYFLLSLRVFGK